MTAIPTAIVHANHRHRGDGRWPSGKSRIRNVPVSPIGGSQLGCDSAMITSALDQPCSNPYWPNAFSRSPPDHASPMTSTSHPIELPGRRVAMSTPITSKVRIITMNGRLARIVAPPQSPDVFGSSTT